MSTAATIHPPPLFNLMLNSPIVLQWNITIVSCTKSWSNTHVLICSSSWEDSWAFCLPIKPPRLTPVLKLLLHTLVRRVFCWLNSNLTSYKHHTHANTVVRYSPFQAWDRKSSLFNWKFCTCQDTKDWASHTHTYTHTVYLSRERDRSGLQVVDLELQKLPDPSWWVSWINFKAAWF